MGTPTSKIGQVAGIATIVLAATLPLLRFGAWEINDTDVGLIQAPWRLVQSLSGAWNPNVFGFDQTRSQALLFPVNMTFGLLQLLHIPVGDRTQVWLGLLVSIAGAGMWWFLAGWLDRAPAWNTLVIITAAVGYMLSTFVIDLSTDTTMFVLPYATLPWLLGIVLRLSSGRISSLRAVGLLALVICFTSAVDIPLLAIDAAATLVFGLALVGRRRQAVVVVAGLVLGIGTLLWTLGPTAWSFRVDPTQANANLSAESASMYDAATSPEAVSRLQGYWALYTGYADRPYRPYYAYYLESPVGSNVGFVLMGLAAAGALLRRRTRAAIAITTMAAVSWRLVIGVHPGAFPAGSSEVFRWAFAHVPLAATFRDTFKFMTVLTFAVVALGAAGLAVWESSAPIHRSRPARRARRGHHARLGHRAHAFRIVGLGAMIFAVVATAQPIWGGQLWWPDKGIQRMPAYWQEAASWLNSRPAPPSERVLLLPNMPFPVYDWGMPPTEPAATLVRRWQVYEVPGTRSVFGQREIATLFHALQAVSRGGGTLFTHLLADARIRYLLVRGDMLTGYYPNVQTVLQTEKWLDSLARVRRVAQFGPLVVYRLAGSLAPLVGCATVQGGNCAARVKGRGGDNSFRLVLTHTGLHRIVSLDEAYARGWQAIGSVASRRLALKHAVINGFANEWQVPGWVRRVTITYEPSAVLGPARALSIGAVVLALLLLAEDLRRRILRRRARDGNRMGLRQGARVQR